MFLSSFEYIELSSSPINETGAQVGADDYWERSRIECKVYKQQLERMFPIPPELVDLVYFAIKKFEHDFGFYREVVIKYDYESEPACDFACHVDSNLPENWDKEARSQLETELQKAGLVADEGCLTRKID